MSIWNKKKNENDIIRNLVLERNELAEMVNKLNDEVDKLNDEIKKLKKDVEDYKIEAESAANGREWYEEKNIELRKQLEETQYRHRYEAAIETLKILYTRGVQKDPYES